MHPAWRKICKQGYEVGYIERDINAHLIMLSNKLPKNNYKIKLEGVGWVLILEDPENYGEENGICLFTTPRRI